MDKVRGSGKERIKMTPIDLLDSAIQEYNPKYVIAMFSGGHDSLVATHITSQHPRFSFALHINTGIGIEQTRDFVRETCHSWGIELREYRADQYEKANGKPDPQIYEEMILNYGFPGPGAHGKMYARLKERPLIKAIRDLDRKRTDKTMLVTGVRNQESIRRMKHVKPIQIWQGTKVWVAPIWNFSKLDINDYIDEHNLKRNSVVDYLHMSGECLCGAYAHPGEKEEIKFWFPEMGNYLDNLETKASERGFDWGWDEMPKKQRKSKKLPGMMCIGCDERLKMVGVKYASLLDKIKSVESSV